MLLDHEATRERLIVEFNEKIILFFCYSVLVLNKFNRGLFIGNGLGISPTRDPQPLVYKQALTYHAFVDKNNTTSFKKISIYQQRYERILILTSCIFYARLRQTSTSHHLLR